MKKNDLSVFEIEKEGFRLKLQRGPSAQAAPVAPPPVAGQSKTAATTAEAAQAIPKTIESVQLKEIVSPMVGTFDRAASRDASPVVAVGKPGTGETVVCIYEAMQSVS